MDRTEVNASPVQRALQGIKKYKYVLLTALLGVLLFEIIRRVRPLYTLMQSSIDQVNRLRHAVRRGKF